MVRTKSSEQAKRLAAKQAARKAKAPPDEPAQPDSFLAQMLRDRRAAADQPETAEEAARAETIAQTRLGAVMAATLCRTNFTQGLQGTSKAVVELLGEGSMVPRKDWFGPMVPDGVRERERERFEIKNPKLPCPLRPVAPEPVATEPAPSPLDAPAPLTAAPAASAADGDGARVPPTAEEGAGPDEGADHDERRAPAAPAAPAASAPGSSADHAAPPPRPPPKGAGGSGDAAAEEPQEEPRFVLPAGSLRPKWACGGELGLCPGCVECIEDHPDRVPPLRLEPQHAPRAHRALRTPGGWPRVRAHRVCDGVPQPRTDDDGRPEPLHSNPGNEAALPLEPNSGPLHLAELVEVVGELEENASFLARRGYALEWHAGAGVYEVLFEEHDERVLIRPANLVRARSLDYNGYGYIFNPLPEVRDGPRRAKRTAPLTTPPQTRPPKDSALLTRAPRARAAAGPQPQGGARALEQPQADGRHDRDAVRSPTPRPARASPALRRAKPSRVPDARPSQRQPDPGDRGAARGAGDDAQGGARPGLGEAACRARACTAAHPARPSLAVQVDAEEWAQVPEDQPIADISLVDTVRAASSHPCGACLAHALQPQPPPRPRVRSRTRTSWCG